MKIETMLDALDIEYDWWDIEHRFRNSEESRNTRQRIRTGIMRRYIRLQQENARLRDDVAFWKLEAQRGEGDDD